MEAFFRAENNFSDDLPFHRLPGAAKYYKQRMDTVEFWRMACEEAGGVLLNGFQSIGYCIPKQCDGSIATYDKVIAVDFWYTLLAPAKSTLTVCDRMSKWFSLPGNDFLAHTAGGQCLNQFCAQGCNYVSCDADVGQRFTSGDYKNDPDFDPVLHMEEVGLAMGG